jgi:hypothetical protein
MIDRASSMAVAALVVGAIATFVFGVQAPQAEELAFAGIAATSDARARPPTRRMPSVAAAPPKAAPLEGPTGRTPAARSVLETSATVETPADSRPAAILRGRLLDGRGEPLVAWRVFAWCSDSESSPQPTGSAICGEDGAFAIAGLDDRAFGLSTEAPHFRGTVPLAASVRAADGEAVYRVPLATLGLRIVDFETARTVRRALHIGAAGADPWTNRALSFIPDEDGVVSVPLPAGKWQANLEHAPELDSMNVLGPRNSQDGLYGPPIITDGEHDQVVEVPLVHWRIAVAAAPIAESVRLRWRQTRRGVEIEGEVDIKSNDPFS